MQRIIDGILYEGKACPDVWEMATFRANGIMERSVRQAIEWVELGPVPPLDALDPVKDAEWIAEKAAESLRKAATRAKTMCRRIIISEGFDELLTITYRENQGDRELCKRHFKEWVRRMKKALGGVFRYCASFEKQERGAMHVHVACHRLPSHAKHKSVRVPGWRLGTEIWRSIVGADNGLVFVGGKSRNGAPRAQRMSLAKMAAYVSKYIMKDYAEAPAGSNRYSRSNGAPLPEVERVRFKATLAEIIAGAFELAPGHVVVSHRLNRWHDGIWLCTEKGLAHGKRRKASGLGSEGGRGGGEIQVPAHSGH